ncbi:copper metallochaperone [alpha proteobacterium U9-1i]|nr:copper metallochaperone [alpha proteobacterium U9-1i]
MRTLIVSLALFAAACGAPEQVPAPAESAGPTVSVSEAWATPTPGGVAVSAGYLTIANSGAEADRLVGAATPRAGRVELHTMTMTDGIMEMRQIESIDVPAGGSAAFAPGGNHLMFIDVATPFAEGEDIPLTLTFEHAGDVQATLPVRAGGHSGH